MLSSELAFSFSLGWSDFFITESEISLSLLNISCLAAGPPPKATEIVSISSGYRPFQGVGI